MIRQTLLLLLIVFSTATLAQPTPVVISVKVEQITGINQKEENYGAVVSQFLKWHEPALALTREERQSGSGTRLFLIPGFVKYMEAKRLNWPSISFFNQQGRTDFENETVSVDEAGNVIYFARFTATFQAPDFDFSHFPLDKQQFNVVVDLLRPETEFVFRPDLERSGLGDTLGEEEWLLKLSDI